MAVTFAWVYEWQNDVAAAERVGFLRARRQLSALQPAVAAAQGLARSGTMTRERKSFIVCKPYGGSTKNLGSSAKEKSTPYICNLVSASKEGPDGHEGVLIYF